MKMVMTADEEEPLCRRCDNMEASDEYCCENCGAGNFWNGYIRIIKNGDDSRISVKST